MHAANSALITVMTNAAHKAAKGIQRDFGEVDRLQVSQKGTLDFVTQTDLRAEKILQEELARARPKFGFLMEEGGEIDAADGTHRWVVDPLDGTTNFIHAVPYVCISIAMEKRNDKGEWEAEAGVIYDPLRDEMFVAEKGKGAFCNNRRLSVSSRQKIEESLLVTHSPKHDRENFKAAMRVFNQITEVSKGIRTMGATALDLAYLAAGRFDGGWYSSYKRWDIAAGLLIAQEARATVTQLEGSAAGNDPQTLLVATPKLHGALLNITQPLWK